MATQENENMLPKSDEPENAGQANNGLLMDYGGLGADEKHPDAQEPGVTVGLVGGQPKDDEGGLDVSQYTGPHSKPSGQFDDLEAPYKTGPGNGLDRRYI